MQQAGLDKVKNVAWLPTGTVVQAGLTGTTQGLHTERIVELSAMFCMELMARGTPEPAVSSPSTNSDTQENFSGASAGSAQPVGSRGPTRRGGLLLRYRSEVKRATVTELARKPGATDLDLCRAFDSNGSVELPKNWQPTPGDREFEKAYRDKRTRPKIEKTISKVRVDMRKAHLLPER
jgi:hypothetical protein